MKIDLSFFIGDILEKINLIENSAGKLSRDEFEPDSLITDATLRRLEIIGEAVKNIPYSFREKHLEVPWKKIAGFGDMILHAYFEIDFNAVWDIIKKELPDLKEKILKIKEQMEKDKT